jgi:hypothetical protein
VHWQAGNLGLLLVYIVLLIPGASSPHAQHPPGKYNTQNFSTPHTFQLKISLNKKVKVTIVVKWILNKRTKR